MSNQLILDAFKAKREEIGTKALSQALDISDSSIRMICTGNHPNPGHVLKKFSEHYNIGWIICTFSGDPISPIECKERSSKPNRPLYSGRIQDWWDICQTCPHKHGAR